MIAAKSDIIIRMLKTAGNENSGIGVGEADADGVVVGVAEGAVDGVELGGGCVGFAVGVGVRVGVGLGVSTRTAVIMPGPPTFASVAIALELSKVMEPLLDTHCKKVYPDPGNALIERGPESTQTLSPVGFVDPPPEGVTAKVNWY